MTGAYYKAFLRQGRTALEQKSWAGFISSVVILVHL